MGAFLDDEKNNINKISENSHFTRKSAIQSSETEKWIKIHSYTCSSLCTSQQQKKGKLESRNPEVDQEFLLESHRRYWETTSIHSWRNEDMARDKIAWANE